MIFLYNSSKSKRSVHVVNTDTGRTYCQIENSRAFHNLDTRNNKFPQGRDVCSICRKQLTIYHKKGTKKKKDKAKKSKSFYKTDVWHRLRYKAFLIHGKRCMVCGATGKDSRLHVDHIKPISKFPQLMTDINNLQILCALCNKGKGNWDETDHRLLKDGLDEVDLSAIEALSKHL